MSEPAVEGEDRVLPPTELEAEEAVLGALLKGDQEALGIVQAVLRPEHFFRSVHAELYRALLDLGTKGEPLEPVFAIRRLTEMGKLPETGFSPLQLADFIESAPVLGSLAFHAKIVLQAAKRRQLIAIGARLTRLGHEAKVGVEELVDRAEAELLAIHVGDRPDTARPSFDRALAELEAIHQGQGGLWGLPTGLVDVDMLLWGLHPGALILIAARPGIGKSALVGKLARNAALQAGVDVLFCSLEMAQLELEHRWLCAESGVPWTQLRAGKARAEDWPKLMRAAERLEDMSVEVMTASSPTVGEVRSKARRLKVTGRLGLVIVDYLQLMSGAGSSNGFRGRQDEVAEISRGLKVLARELEVPVVACSQLNRQIDQRQEKRPQLSDLRDSGSLEQDADVVLFLHQPEDRDYVELIAAKNRNGPTGSVPLTFRRDLTRFESWAKKKGEAR